MEKTSAKPIKDRQAFDKAFDEATNKTKPKKKNTIPDRHEFDKAVDDAMEKSNAAKRANVDKNKEKKRSRSRSSEDSSRDGSREKSTRDGNDGVPSGKRQKIDKEVELERHEKRVVRTEIEVQEVAPELRPHLMGRKAETKYGSPKPRANFPVAANMSLDEVLGRKMKEIANDPGRNTPVGVRKIFTKDHDGAPTKGYLVDYSMESSQTSSDGPDLLENSTESPGRLVVVDTPNNNGEPPKSRPNMTITVSSNETSMETIAVSSTETLIEVPTGGEQPEEIEQEESGDQEDISQGD